jgi:ABC-type multidrug transport system ATPase subunit
MMNKLEIDSIQLYVGNHRQLLTDCYLSCSSEEIIGILGRNRSGKSSLFEIIFGTLEPSNKFIRINGQVCKTPFAKKLVG